MISDHARTLFKLSEALTQEPRTEDEALKLREESERLLRTCNPQAKDAGLEETYDREVYISWR
jgi:hypothetical protein